MIREHCGERLVYIEGRFNDSRLQWHQWQCPVCRKKFKQNVRQSAPKVKPASDTAS